MDTEQETIRQFAADIYCQLVGENVISTTNAQWISGQAEQYAKAYVAYKESGVEEAMKVIKGGEGE